MDKYLLEQQEQLSKVRKNFIKDILYFLGFFTIIWLVIAIVASFGARVICSSSVIQTVDEYTHTKIVIQGQLAMMSGKNSSSSYYIQDEGGNRYHVSEEQYDRLSKQLVSGQTYEAIYCRSVSDSKFIRLLKDDSQTYIGLNERVAFFQEGKSDYIRVNTLKTCIIGSAGLVLFLFFCYAFLKKILNILLYKKRIRYYLCQGVPLSEAKGLGTTTMTKMTDIVLTSEEVQKVFNQQLLSAKKDYKLEKITAIIMVLSFIIGSGVLLYTCLLGIYTAGIPSETEWETREIVFAEISKDSYYKDLNYYCICDQEGNKYTLSSSSEYRYYDLLEQLQSGHSYQIVYGVNKYINREMNNLYQLHNGSVTYVSADEARLDIQNNQKHQRNLNIFCLIWVALVSFIIWLTCRNDLKKSKQVVLNCEGRIQFYEHTGIVLLLSRTSEAEVGEEESKPAAVADATIVDPQTSTATAAKAVQAVHEPTVNSSAMTKGISGGYFSAEGDKNVLPAANGQYYQRHFAARNVFLILAGVALVVLGGYNIYQGLHLWQNIGTEVGFYTASYLLQGSMLVLLGLWMMYIFRRRIVEISEGAIIACEGSDMLLGGWISYFVSILFLMLFRFAKSTYFNYSDFIYSSIIFAVIAWFIFWCFGSYRNRRLILTEDTLEKVTAIGTKSYCERREIVGIKKAGLRLKMLDADGRKLISVKTTMLNSKKIFLALGGDKYYKYESNDDHADK